MNFNIILTVAILSAVGLEKELSWDVKHEFKCQTLSRRVIPLDYSKHSCHSSSSLFCYTAPHFLLNIRHSPTNMGQINGHLPVSLPFCFDELHHIASVFYSFQISESVYIFLLFYTLSIAFVMLIYWFSCKISIESWLCINLSIYWCSWYRFKK